MMPDNDWQPSEDFLWDCKDLLWNAVAHLQAIEEGHILLEIALDQFDRGEDLEALKRVEVLLKHHQSAVRGDMEDLRCHLARLWRVVRPNDLAMMPTDTIQPTVLGTSPLNQRKASH
jgi:exonuclease VII small subunit